MGMRNLHKTTLHARQRRTPSTHGKMPRTGEGKPLSVCRVAGSAGVIGHSLPYPVPYLDAATEVPRGTRSDGVTSVSQISHNAVHFIFQFHQFRLILFQTISYTTI